VAEEPKPGSIVHVEFAVKDPKKVEKFYGNLFGWKFEEVPGMNYWLIQTPSGPGGGVGPLQENQTTGITNYIFVNSIDEYVKKIEKAGGKITAPKLEVPGQGWMAWFQDPAGTSMALWQPSPEAQREQQQQQRQKK
jgi:predicted enzyme related to lactoylglutathione lyase